MTAYLTLVVSGFSAFMVVLAYGVISSNLASREA